MRLLKERRTRCTEHSSAAQCCRCTAAALAALEDSMTTNSVKLRHGLIARYVLKAEIAERKQQDDIPASNPPSAQADTEQ